MSPFGSQTTKPIIGRAPEELSISERFQNAGKWVALELYTPPAVKVMEKGPEVEFKLRRIRALGNSVEECMQQLQQAGLDPEQFEYTRLIPAY